MTQLESLNREELLRVVRRDGFVKEQLSNRLAALVRENLEFMAIIQEIQAELAEVRQGQFVVSSDGDTTQQEEPAFDTS